MKRKSFDQPEIDISNEANANVKKNKNNNMDVTMSNSEGEIESTNVTTTTSKTEKYDRQIRLWGEDGQHDLETAHVCLINVSALGTEILKCLVLPGIGQFTIIDNTNVSKDDLGSNFFLDPNSLGTSKAKSACELLQELNPDTKGNYVCQDPIELVESNSGFFEQFTLVICSRMCERGLINLGNVLWRLDIPMFVCDSFGFLGYMRLVVKEHVIINAQPDNILEDLRLDYQFPEIQTYMDKVDMESMDKLQHSHTPYLIILYKFLEKWRKETNSEWPSSYSDRRQIRDKIREGIMKNADGVPEFEENFNEAINNCNTAFTKTSIPSEVNKILNMVDSVDNFNELNVKNKKFWLLVKALKEFVKMRGVLPIRGTLPDMFSNSKQYIELQNIYKNLANRDTQFMIELVAKCLQEHNLPFSFLTHEDVRLFCKNSFFLHVIQGISLQDELSSGGSTARIKETISNYWESGGVLYTVIRTLNRFCNSGRFPFTREGSNDDMEQVKKCCEQIIQELGVNSSQDPYDYFEELQRCRMSDIHVIAAILGGACAQEIIKVITKQFVPVDNMLFFNGMTQETISLKL